MDCKYESAIKVVLGSAENVYARLSDMSNFSNALPPNDKISNFVATTDTCHFAIEGMGEMGLRIAERKENSFVKYTADGSVRFNFNLWVQMKGVSETESRLRVTLKADLNPMLKMMAAKPLQKFVDSLADGISKQQY